MALKKEAIAKLAELSKLTPEALTEAITKPEEVEITIPDKLTVFSETELNTFQKNKYEDGRKAGIEMGVKDAATKLGIEFSGKTIDGLLDAATKKALADADKNPDQRVTELSAKIATLQGNITQFQTQIQDKETAMKQLQDNYELFRHVPAPVDGGVNYSQDEVIAVMKMRGYEFKRDADKKMVAYKDGQPQQDQLGNALPVGDIVKGFMKEARYISEEAPTPGGRGGSDKGGGSGGKVTKMSELEKKYIDAGKSINGSEFAAEAEALIKDPNSGFDAFA